MTRKTVLLSILTGILAGAVVGIARVEIRTASMRVRCERDGGHWSRGLAWHRGPDITYTCRYG